MPIHTLLADPHPERRDQLQAALSSDAQIEILGAARDGGECLRLARVLRPEVVLIADDLPPDGGFAAAAALSAAGLPLETILVCADDSDAALRRAMRAGAREVVCRTAGAAALQAAVQSVYADLHRRSTPAADARPPGRIVAVTSAKGGVGTTTLAVNLAAALAAETGERTVLLDLHTQFADAALLLNLFPRRTLADWALADPADWDAALVEDHAERHACGLALLAGAAAPMDADGLTLALLDRLLALLRGEYAHIVVDLPAALSEASRRVLEEADCVLLTANLFDLATLAATRLWLDAVPLNTVQVGLNRAAPSNKLQPADAARALGRPADWQIPNDGKIVPASVNSGIPFVLSHPSSRAACAVSALGRSLYAARR